MHVASCIAMWDGYSTHLPPAALRTTGRDTWKVKGHTKKIKAPKSINAENKNVHMHKNKNKAK